MLQVVLKPGMSNNPAKFEETWKSWEHQVDIYENLSSTKLDDDVKISVVLRVSPQKLRDHLLVNSQQFESNYNKLRSIIQSYLNTNKTWIVNDFRETDPMDVDHTGKIKGKSKSKGKGKSKGNSKSGSNGKGKSKDCNQGKGKSKNNNKGKGSGKPDNDKECYVCGKKGHFARDCWSRANHDKMVNEVEVENVNAEPGEEYVYTIEHEINDVHLSQDGFVEREDGLVMIDSGASVNVCSKWFGNSKLEQSDGGTGLRGADGKPLLEHGKRQIWLKICGQTKRYDFHVVNVTKPILSVSCLCEQGVETHLAKKSFLRFGDGHEPLIRKGEVYFVQAQTVNASVRVDECTEKTHEYNLMGDQKTDEYELMDSQKTREYNLMGAQKIDEYELMDSQKNREYEMTGARKVDAYKLKGAQKTREYEMTGARKTDAYEPMGAQNVRVDKSEKSRVQTEKVQNPCVQNSSRVGVWKDDGVEIIHNNQRNPACQDADVKPIVRDPMDDDRVLVESGAEMTLVPHEPTEFEKQKHFLTHIPFQPWCTSCVKAKHKRNHISAQSATSKTANSQ